MTHFGFKHRKQLFTISVIVKTIENMMTDCFSWGCVTKTDTNNHLVAYLNIILSSYLKVHLKHNMVALVLNLSVFFSLVKVTLMGLSATAHGALIGMTKLINWTPLFQGTGPQDFYYEHTIPQLASHPFKWGL